jgi:hypothetical protein
MPKTSRHALKKEAQSVADYYRRHGYSARVSPIKQAPYFWKTTVKKK